MRKIKRMLLWFRMLTKRLYKKPTFLAILVLIPLLVFGYGMVAEEDSGVATVALYGNEEPLTQKILTELTQDSQLLQYTRCETPQEAEKLVRGGKADMAWIFPEDLEGSIKAFTDDPGTDTAFLRVVLREENVVLMLARERLSGIVYPYIARNFYINFLREEYPELNHLSDEQLLVYYDGTQMSEELFQYEGKDPTQVQQVHYLLAPVRGLLAIVIILGGMATAMYSIRDRENGTFQWLPSHRQILPELGGQVIGALNLGIAAWLAMVISGLASGFFRELIVLLEYSLCVSFYCMLLRRVLGNIRRIGTAIPLLIVAMLLVCPVFFDFGKMRLLQFVFPPTYYVNGAYNEAYLGYMLGYTALCALGCLVVDKIKGVYAHT